MANIVAEHVDYDTLALRIIEDARRIAAAYQARPPTVAAAIARLKAFREYLEYCSELDLPISVSPIGRFMPGRSARRMLLQVGRAIAYLDSGEVDVLHDTVANILCHPTLYQGEVRHG